MKKANLITMPRVICAIIIITLVPIIMMFSVLAKYVITNETSPEGRYITDFDVYTEMYFVDPHTDERTPAVFDPMYTNFVSINLHDKSAFNYIDNFRCELLYRGESPFYTRVIIESFIVETSDGKFSEMNLDIFKINKYNKALAPEQINQNSWYDNTSYDGGFYWANLLSTAGSSDPEKYDTITLLEGANSGYNHADYMDKLIYVTFRAEAVQINRYNAFWNMYELPWKHE